MDSDLQDCLIHNPQDFEIDDIKDVLAVWEGERDGDNWRWVIELNGGDFAFIEGWCCYTGWDCQSGANVWVVKAPVYSAIDAANYVTETDVRDNLVEQIILGKRETWREKTDKVMGVDSTDPTEFVDLDGAL